MRKCDYVNWRKEVRVYPRLRRPLPVSAAEVSTVDQRISHFVIGQRCRKDTTKILFILALPVGCDGVSRIQPDYSGLSWWTEYLVGDMVALNLIVLVKLDYCSYFSGSGASSLLLPERLPVA
jgi:hypothetical protein